MKYDDDFTFPNPPVSCWKLKMWANDLRFALERSDKALRGYVKCHIDSLERRADLAKKEGNG